LETKPEYIKKLFQNRILFDKVVLNVKNDQDRQEVIQILAGRLLSDKLKEHLNFVHIRNLSDFTLNKIVNILFKEIADEWIDYAIHDLNYYRNDALKELNIKERVSFIRDLAEDYYIQFKEHIFEEIADSFIDLLVLNSKKNTKSAFINAVINSDFFINRRELNINSSDQLCKSAKEAKDLKDGKLSAFKQRITEIKNGRCQLNISQEKKDEFARMHANYERNFEDVKKLKLENFDETLQIVKESLVNALKQQDIKN